MGDLYHPLSLNPYSYVEGNPVRYIDPMGYWATEFATYEGHHSISSPHNETNRAIRTLDQALQAEQKKQIQQIIQQERWNQIRYKTEASLYDVQATLCDTIVRSYEGNREWIPYIPVAGFSFTAGEGLYTVLSGDDFYRHGMDMDTYIQDWSNRTKSSAFTSITFLSGMVSMGYTGEEPVVGTSFQKTATISSNPSQEKSSYSVITSKTREKILTGERVKGNNFRGGHSPRISNDNPKYAVEIISEKSDGTKVVKFITEFEDGNISRIKKSTIFPDSWSDDDIIHSIGVVSNTPAVGIRDNFTLHRGIVNGVEIEVIKEINVVVSGYPTGGSHMSGFEMIE